MGPYKCNLCNKSFENASQKANHVRWKHKKPFTEDGKKRLKDAAFKSNEKRFGKWVTKKVICNICGNEFEKKYREGRRPSKFFCSVSCRNTRTHSKETKERLSEASIEAWHNPEKNKLLYEALDKRIESEHLFSSKGERKMRDYFKEKFPTDNWTFGGGIKQNGLRLSRDLFSKKLKICIEYDGIWHFKDIKGQLADKQAKDKALEDWCIANDYRLIRISEEVFQKDKNKWLKILEEQVYNSTEQIIKNY